MQSSRPSSPSRPDERRARHKMMKHKISHNTRNHSAMSRRFLPMLGLCLALIAKASGAEEEPLASAETSALDDQEDQGLLSQPFDYHANMPVITKRELSNAIAKASQMVQKLRVSTEPNLLADNQLLMEAGSPGWIMQTMFHRAAHDERALNQSDQALISEEATRLLANQYKLSRLQTLRGLPLISIDQTNLGKLCQRSSRNFNCLAGQYRSLSGHCNNVQNPDWGSARSPLMRYAPARYLDNVARPLESSSSAGDRLPSARAVSSAIYAGQSSDKPLLQQHSHMTTMMSFFGQFVFHDLAQVAQFAAHGGQSTIRCCGLASASRHPECMPIEHQTDSGKRYCLDYVRSTPAIRSGCNLGPRDQLNLVSSYLDGSAIYGSSEAQMRRLRAFSGGRLRGQPVSAQQPATGGQQVELLPQIKLAANDSGGEQEIWARALDDCAQLAKMRRRSAADERCFQAGDSRVNENIGLTLMHTIWLREHNLIADRLAQINKHWRDERLFEEARRLVVAELQHITYNEFLPAIIGQEVMQRFNLSAQTQGYFQGYDPQLNAAVSNELATAVFPFILSTIPSALERYSDRLEMIGSTQLADTFMDGSELFKRNRFAQYLMGMMSQNAMDPLMGTMPMTMALNESLPEEPPLVDVLALTIQQARDHGLKPYLYWRQVCQLRPQVSTWQDLSQVMPAKVVERLRKVYSSPQQLDLYLALLETPLPGATVGPTFVCLLARQFFHLKHGDRYWYENDLPTSAFSPQQLEQIRQTSLAKVVCRNTNSAGVNFIQPAPLLASDPYLNAYQYCTNRAMVQLDLSKWREPVTSAQQLSDELMMGELDAARDALARGRQLLESGGAQLLGRSLRRARRQLEQELTLERSREKRAASSSIHAAYRHSTRLKRQTAKLNNQSLLFELATNEMVRALVRQGKDREQAQSVQADIRDFLYSLETVQLDNLLDNSGDSARLQQFIASAGESFLEADQRVRLLQSASQDTPAELAESQLLQRTSSVSANCQDDDRAFPCDHTSPFRTITGWCNNLLRPKFGQSFTPLDRLLPSAYEDGLAKPRQLSVALSPGGAERLPLPSARLISTTMHDDQSQLHARYSLALMQFGQFGVDHDLTRTPFSLAADGSLLDCSACDSQRTVHRDCLPIEIPPGDAHFESAKARELRGTERKCLHFVRSLNGQTSMGPRQQINALTAYMDASNIYGSDNCEARSLRSMQGGRLNSSAYPATTQPPAKELLPVTRANPECVTPSGVCFHAGDQRASEQPGLSSIHTVFMRLHNSVVGQLAQVNRHWNDERLYQHGRRIVAAIMQRITYSEFAPRILGLDYMSKFDLLLKNVGYSDSYDPDCSASILTEFAAAAFRMGHSLIRNAFPLLNKQFKPIGKAFQLRKAFFNSQRILQEPFLIDAILRGVVSTPIETLDNAITEELTNHLFEKPKEPFSGMDLISLNIQRARDHGIAGYNRYRAKCNLTRARTFDDLSAEIPAKLIQRLRSLYAHPDDIDLFTGGMSEQPVHGGIIGPTFGCIIGLQLSRLKRCDRFWHETSDPFVRFSPAQLAEIRKMTLAKVICQESDTIDSIQRQAMEVPDQYLNPRLPCSSLPAMDLSVWRENLKSCLINQPNNKPAVKLELGQTKRLSPCRSCTCTSEGPICRSARIDCVKAMGQTAGQLATVMADKACLVQCAWALDMQPLVAG